MKKLKAFSFALLLFFASIIYVYAACDATETNELNSLAVNVGVDYEIIEKEITVDEGFNPPDGLTEEEQENYTPKKTYFRIHIRNVTEDLYVVVTNQSTNQSTTYTYDNAVDGVISFDESVYIFSTNYTIEVYSSALTNCPNTKLYTTYLTTPMYNSYSETAICDGIEDFYLCHEYLSVSIDNISYADFLKLAEEYKAGNLNDDGTEKNPVVEEDENGFIQFLKDNAVIVIVVVIVIIAAGGLITYVVIRKQRSRIV